MNADQFGHSVLHVVIQSDDAVVAIRTLSDQALVDLLRHTDQGGWAARLVNGLGTIEAAARFRNDEKGPSFP